MRKFETKLTDAEGNSIRYECKPFGFDQAFDLGLELAAVVGGPLGEAFKGLLLGADLDDDRLDEAVIGKALASVGELPDRLIARGGSELLAKLLANVQRMGSDEAGTVRQHMSDPEDRDAAYGGGNLREALDAAKWVIEINYGPFLTGLLDALRPQLEALIAPVNPSPEETAQSSAPPTPPLKPVERVSSTSST